VAKLAGLPDSIISRAKTYLKEFETEGTGGLPQHTGERSQISLSDIGTDEVRRILEGTDLNTLTPLEAMNLLSELQKKARA
jgi:DNA mismatch repair protein MutS